ncbi:MAG: NUDIX hydrolase [Anaerolineae bacterium]|nr:NUDIX hydrolase [Anaerolineae bacterium]
MQLWKTLARKVVLHYDRFLTVEEHRVELPSGQVIPAWPWVITPDYINVVVITEEGRFLCFRQTKYAVDGVTLALVGGYIEPGEVPLAAAQREVLEETGYQADRWTDLGGYAVDGNRGAGKGYLFLAQGARRVTDPNADDLEEQETLFLNRAEFEAAVRNGAFQVLAWAAAAALALARL